MAEFTKTIDIDCPAQKIFEFVGEVSNLPRYLPTTKHAEPQGADRVRVQGEAKGHKYDGDGYLRRDAQNMRLEWGADEGYYSGWMQVNGQGDRSQVTVCLNFKSKPGGADHAPSDADIEEGMQRSLESIRNQVTGQGSKVEPAAAT